MNGAAACVACLVLAAGGVQAQASGPAAVAFRRLVVRTAPPPAGPWLERLAALPDRRLQALEGIAAPWAARLIRGLRALRAGDPRQAMESLAPLLHEPSLKTFVAETGGPVALRGCRNGARWGRRFLEAVVAAFPQAAWARANLGLALRLLGKYRQAEIAYADAAAVGGRRAWILADWALVKLAEGLESEAIALLEEGARDPSDARGRATCRTNLAVILFDRALPGDRRRAVILLDSVLAEDPGRLRAAYYRERLRLGLP